MPRCDRDCLGKQEDKADNLASFYRLYCIDINFHIFGVNSIMDSSINLRRKCIFLDIGFSCYLRNCCCPCVSGCSDNLNLLQRRDQESNIRQEDAQK